jgi:hypothetical protein
VSRSAAILASLLVTLGRPAWWPLALATFLVRGGLVLFILPIIVIPSPLALSNVVAPLVVPVAFGRISGDALVVAGVAAAAIFFWLVFAGWLASVIELALVRQAAAAAIEEGIGERPSAVSAGHAPPPGSEPARDRDVAGGMLGARLVTSLPLAVAIALGAVRIVAVAYLELTNPTNVALPLPVRVALGAAPEIGVIVATWLASELIGGLAGRRIALDGVGVRIALRAAVTDVIRRPRTALVPWIGSSLVLWLALAGLLVAARVAWEQVQLAVSGPPPDGIAIAATVLVFVTVWLGGLTLVGLLGAIRTASGTFEEVRLGAAGRSRGVIRVEGGPDVPGTFGASTHRRPGDWSVGDDGGSL